MRRPNIYILVSVLLLTLLSFLFESLNKDSIETTYPTDHVRIDSLRFCGVTTLKENVQTVSICGTVVADKKSIPIRMYLYEMPNKILVAQNQVGERFSTGDFVQEFELPDSQNGDTYKIVVYFYKTIIGEFEFEVQNP